MATLLELQQRGEIFRFDPALAWNEFEDRRIFLLPPAREWIEHVLPTLGSTWNIEVSPEEQLDTLFFEFCSGQSLAVGGQFKKLNPVDNGMWELKTSDLRVFGWFPSKDCFVATDCDDTDKIKRLKLYRGYCEQGVRRRDALDLDQPKYITGGDSDAVVSNCY